MICCQEGDAEGSSFIHLDEIFTLPVFGQG